jgi:hypothetical protein
MASYRNRFKDCVNRQGATIASVMIRDLKAALEDIEWLDKDNDELRRENERLLKALAPTMPPPAAPEPELCCGGTCVRAVCFIHGAGNG